MNLRAFLQDDLFSAGKDFFENQLGYRLNSKTRLPISLRPLAEQAGRGDWMARTPFRHIDQTYFLGILDDNTLDGQSLFGQTELDWNEARNKAEGGGQRTYPGIMVFALRLQQYTPTRSELANMARFFNQISHSAPVVVLSQYPGKSGETLLAFATTERNPYKQNWRPGEKVGKVSLLKDINPQKPHGGHLKILRDLAVQPSVRSFKDLQDHWRRVFDVAVLNKKFFQELANWYFWAVEQVEFPDDVEKDSKKRNAVSTIRLVTRLMFVWFLKEKGLIQERLFRKEEIDKLLNYNDVNGSNYYRAILQNLFFATLNTEMNQNLRKFVNRQYGVHSFYRYEKLFKNPDNALSWFEDIPFLNGGLFECLDSAVGKPEEIRIDAFTDSPEKQKRLKVPDELFFGGEREVDLNATFDTKNKRYKVRGLIHILNDYKFTVDENTPIEQEIALDPELLGKVFENLLANFNPETSTTARKQTGSFYTPREIVSYMVQESLLAYFENYITEKLESGQFSGVFIPPVQGKLFGEPQSVQTLMDFRRHGLNEEQKTALRDKLRLLISYEHEGNPFDNEQEVRYLVEAIDRIRIIDPAVGSGAFPMGILQTLVRMLAKLDPNNTHWRAVQLENAEQQAKKAFQLESKNDREVRLKDINEVFDLNSSDYGRKLYLIENCIFGVDIQPIAIQICKLRFFISLIVDEHVDRSRENLGVRPLPNLETKFVAANSLIGLSRSLTFKPVAAEKLEEELKLVRQKYFLARTPPTKEKYRLEDERLRRQIAEILKQVDFPESEADRIAAWKPYDLNAAAAWFDPNWMFGIQEGFDVVIGNPPYYQIQKLEAAEKAELEKQQYDTYTRTGDLYCLFYEKGWKMLKPKAVLTYISSNKWMRADYGAPTRAFFSKKTDPRLLVDFGMTQVFESATTYTNILLLKHRLNKKRTLMCRIREDYSLSTPLYDYVQKNHSIADNLSENAWVAYSQKEYELKRRVEKQGIPIEKWDVQINYGIKTGYNEAFIIDEDTKSRLMEQDPKSAEIIKPLLRGQDIKAWAPEFAGLYLINSHNGIKQNAIHRVEVEKDYPAIYQWLKLHESALKKRQDKGDHWTNLRNCAYLEEFSKPKIIYPNMTNSLPFAFDNDVGYFSNDKSFILTGESIRYLLCILNSELFKFCFRDNFPELLGDTREVRKVFFDKIPIKQIGPEREQPFEKVVDYIVDLKYQKHATPAAAFFERLANAMVYELYFGPELKTAGCTVLEHLQELPELNAAWSDAQKLEHIEAVYRRLSDPAHPLSVALFKMDTVEEIRIIEGKA